MHRNRLLPLLASAVLVAPSAFGQGVTGSAMTGAVTDKGGGPLGGVAIVLRNPTTGDAYSATSGKDGRYFLDNVRSGGPYTLTANLSGYKPATQEDIVLSLGQRLTANLTLVPNDFVEEIAVVAHLDTLGDKKRGGPATTVKATTITALPLQGRNFTDLISTDPRVVSGSIGGQNNRFNNIQIDGGANNDIFAIGASGIPTPGGQSNAKPLSLEAVQEFVIVAAPFDVRQSNFTGGLVNAITKSGTNSFHGGLFGYYQSRDLANKNSYFWKNGIQTYDTDPTFLTFSTGQFGGFLGGPIVKDKAHFFAS